MFQATYLGKQGSKIRVVHDLGIFHFSGGEAQNVPTELGRWLRHTTKTGEQKPGFFTIDLEDLMSVYGESRVDVLKKVKKTKKPKATEKKKPVEYDREKYLEKKIKKQLRIK